MEPGRPCATVGCTNQSAVSNNILFEVPQVLLIQKFSLKFTLNSNNHKIWVFRILQPKKKKKSLMALLRMKKQYKIPCTLYI